ncbi:hypothetical protein PISL3812_05714 [Talaromyces islandicus]|uniref:Uncharacterized protein n=1 Tax=Talaromyces islandicus TaxID=28573 RepID=A0A0U1M0Y8_TALIS|nr:hypothetical protein PISL3812_05714 [Talaromyces islandicus]
MSSFPKARKSNMANVRVTPEIWDAHPEVLRSTISDSSFVNLSSANHISTSTISHSTLEDVAVIVGGQNSQQQKIKHIDVYSSQVHGSALFSSQINRSKLDHCTVTDSLVSRSTLEHCTVQPPTNKIERSTAGATKFMGAKLVSRSQLEDSVVLGGSTVNRCVVRNSVVADGANCDRTQLDDAAVTRSRIDRSKLSNCDVMDCVMDKTTFEGMILKYGIWRNGDLVGRTTTTEEVVIKPRTYQLAAKPTSSASAESPVVARPRALSPVREPGWKAAEAAGEQLDDSDPIDDPYLLSSDDEQWTDDELAGPSSRPKAQTLRGGSTAIKDEHDPPPPYEA